MSHRRYSWRSFVMAAVLMLAAIRANTAQNSLSPAERELYEGLRLYRQRDYAGAAQRLAAATRLDPALVTAHLYLGHAHFYQNHWDEAARAYEKAFDIARQRPVLDQMQRRILTDNLGMAYALGGKLERARSLFENAVREDPDYPLYYYNMACALAELGESEAALVNLEAAVRRQGNLPPGIRFPDPRDDPSLRRLAGHKRFREIVSQLDKQSPRTR
jgi:tetratricopeptide (TPR) repeat protein